MFAAQVPLPNIAGVPALPHGLRFRYDYLSEGKVDAGLTCCEFSGEFSGELSGELFLEDPGEGVWAWKTMYRSS